MPQIFSLQNDPLNYNSFFSACILTYTPNKKGITNPLFDAGGLQIRQNSRFHSMLADCKFSRTLDFIFYGQVVTVLAHTHSSSIQPFSSTKG